MICPVNMRLKRRSMRSYRKSRSSHSIPSSLAHLYTLHIHNTRCIPFLEFIWLEWAKVCVLVENILICYGSAFTLKQHWEQLELLFLLLFFFLFLFFFIFFALLFLRRLFVVLIWIRIEFLYSFKFETQRTDFGKLFHIFLLFVFFGFLVLLWLFKRTVVSEGTHLRLDGEAASKLNSCCQFFGMENSFYLVNSSIEF